MARGLVKENEIGRERKKRKEERRKGGTEGQKDKEWKEGRDREREMGR
jgi:hypothetical protein